MPSSVYRLALGAKLDRLPPMVRALHDVTATQVWKGTVDVERGQSIPSRLLASAFRLPPAGSNQTLEITLSPHAPFETWDRRFGRRRFRSRQCCPTEGMIRERFGPVTLELEPVASDRGLELALRGIRFARFALPAKRLLGISTREWQADGLYRFEVKACLPGFGRLVAYRGWLAPSR